MNRFLFAASAIALVVGLAIGQDRGRQDDKRKSTKGSGDPPAAGNFGGGQGAFPGQPDARGGFPFAGRMSPAAARRMLPQYEEEVELIEAQRDIRKAHVRAAEVAVKSAEVQFDLLDRAGDRIPQMERMKARLEVEAARAQLEIKVAEMKEVEVRVKHAKKRVEDAKTAAAAPPPERGNPFEGRFPGTPKNDDRGGGDTRPPPPGLKQAIQDGERVVEEKKARLAEAMAAAADAQAQLVRIREVARQGGRVAAADIEAAEVRDQAAQVQVEKARAELKKAQDVQDGARNE